MNLQTMENHGSRLAVILAFQKRRSYPQPYSFRRSSPFVLGKPGTEKAGEIGKLKNKTASHGGQSERGLTTTNGGCSHG